MNNKLLLSVDEVVEGLGIGRTSVFALFKTGQLKTVKIGRRTFVKPDDLQAFIDTASQQDLA